MRIRASIALIVLLSSSFVLAASPKPKDAVAAIRAADQEWARVFAARDIDKSVGMCAESASVLAPNAPRATGRDAIRQSFSGFFALPDLVISWQPSDIRVARAGDLGYSTGAYQMTFKDPAGKTIADHGKYATIWEKQRDGSWKVVLDVFNSDMPAVAPSP